ncbi:hypothetical protein [Robiginitalea marina]|uniref:Uncharacterized protein n=1 Tax=Robiginitalea marina TaxID=2954105 RepID=A0ABT1ATV1_9FLAO|nr:hypothetical protein [Robiginitalea marina]MCO5723351.1 hypothetical protein [Robiginitalea marina]
MKKILFFLMLGGLVFTSCEQEDLSSQVELDGVAAKAKKSKENTKNNDQSVSSTSFDFENAPCDAVKEAELYAGQHTLVGKVTVDLIDGEYTITYTVNSGYCLTETHLSVVDSPENFPMSGNGNPPPGQFEYKGNHECTSSVTYTVPNTGAYIAAHAVVKCVEIVVPELPEVADFCIDAQGVNAGGTYFDVTVDGMALSGGYGAWCVDVDLGIGQECIEDALVYSSLDFPPALFENPQNMPAVNWLLNNQDEILGTTSAGVGGIYNFGDFQNAIWLLIDDEPTRSGLNLGDYDDTLGRAGEIRQMALEAIENGYTPGCGDFVGVILVPVDESSTPNKQAIIIPIPVECKERCSETAWARNSASRDCGNFPGNNWATYFMFDDSE